MKVLITETQNFRLRDNLVNLIDKRGLKSGIDAVGSIKVLSNIIGKELLYEILVQHGFDPVNDVKRIKNKTDLPVIFKGNTFTWQLNSEIWGKVYLLIIDNESFLYRKEGFIKGLDGEPITLIGDGRNFDHIRFFNNNIIKPLGLRVNQIGNVLDLFYNEEEY
jgi:hypothetical protein